MDELGHAARLCYSVAYPQMAEDVSYDMVFDAAMWECVRRIAAIPGTEAAMELTSLRPFIGADGNSSELMKALILKQQRQVD